MSRSSKYINEMVRLKCSPDLLATRVFPNAKEITESFAAYHAVRDHLRVDFGNPNVAMLAVGDGSSPRTGATFAFRSAWQCHSVDPRMRAKRSWECVDRLFTQRARVEDVFVGGETVVVVAVHSHADLGAAVKACIAKTIHVVAIPCCVPQTLSVEPSVEYEDDGIWSPQRTVRVWRSVPQEAA